MSTPIVLTRSYKSVVLALILAFFFGPFGLLYASISGGLIMLFIPVVLCFLFILGLFQEDPTLLVWSFSLILIFTLTYWLILLIWAAVAIKNYNDEVDEDTRKMLIAISSKDQTNVVVNISQRNSEGQILTKVSEKPALQDWLKGNPGRSINDYFSKFGR